MYLHNNKEAFESIISKVHMETKIPPHLIEKDYYVTLVLKRLIEKEPLLIFKGGSCLSTCYKLIDRFSEDIDINLKDINSLSQGKKKKMSACIKEAIDEFGFNLKNPERINSGMSHNTYRISYPALFQGMGNPPEVQLETMFLIDTFPTQKMKASSLIYDYLSVNGYNDIVADFGLEPFDVTAQSLERTFVDKVFALGTHYMNGKMERQSRHLYDLHKILPHIKFDNSLNNLFDEVREAWKNRKGNKDWIAAEDIEDLPKLLRKIISSEAYKNDYEKLMTDALYEDAPYEKVIQSFTKIVSELDNEMEM